MEIPPFPVITEIGTWKTKFMHNVFAASASDDPAKIQTWVGYIWKDTTTFAMLAIDMCPVELRSLGGKVLIAMNKMLDNARDSSTKFLKNRITREMNSGVSQGCMTSGRQIVWIMLNCFRSADKADIFSGFDHLSAVTMMNNDLQDYSDRFDEILESMDPIVRESCWDAWLRSVGSASRNSPFHRTVADTPRPIHRTSGRHPVGKGP